MKKTEQNFNFGGIIIIVILVLLYQAYDKLYSEPKRKREQEKEFVDYWTKPTIDFFKKFNCSNLTYNEKDIAIKKFIVVETYSDNTCDLSIDYDFIPFDELKFFQNYYTRNINDANVIIWIYTEKGNTEGLYTNLAKAIRYRSVVNYIDKATKTIYKKEKIDYLGEPPKEITRRGRSTGGSEYFGEKPKNDIIISIGHEIEKHNPK